VHTPCRSPLSDSSCQCSALTFSAPAWICRASSHRSPALDKFHLPGPGGYRARFSPQNARMHKCRIFHGQVFYSVLLGSTESIIKSQRSGMPPKAFDRVMNCQFDRVLSGGPLFRGGPRQMAISRNFQSARCISQSKWLFQSNYFHSPMSDTLHVSIDRSPFFSGKPTIRDSMLSSYEHVSVDSHVRRG
jgi:hypothetical protein